MGDQPFLSASLMRFNDVGYAWKGVLICGRLDLWAESFLPLFFKGFQTFFEVIDFISFCFVATASVAAPPSRRAWGRSTA